MRQGLGADSLVGPLIKNLQPPQAYLVEELCLDCFRVQVVLSPLQGRVPAAPIDARRVLGTWETLMSKSKVRAHATLLQPCVVQLIQPREQHEKKNQRGRATPRQAKGREQRTG